MKAKVVLVNILLFSLTLLYSGCSKDISPTVYKTKNVIIVVVDGARYSETWGDSSHQYISNRYILLSQGVLCSNFHNNGVTATVPGHTAICTGNYENINNGGMEYPTYPSFLQYWNKINPTLASKAWVITTKDKLQVLSDCTDSLWKGKYIPNTDCGNSGLGTGYRDDSTTFQSTIDKLSHQQIQLAIINFKQPDAAGHANDSLGYLQGIFDTDNYIGAIWQQIQNDVNYKDKTTLIVTNDHGRHTPGVSNGFVSHGDQCEGCKHIEFFALGPDFKQNYISTKPYEQIDIPNTVSELLGIFMPTSKGKVMKDLFK